MKQTQQENNSVYNRVNILFSQKTTNIVKKSNQFSITVIYVNYVLSLFLIYLTLLTFQFNIVLRTILIFCIILNVFFTEILLKKYFD